MSTRRLADFSHGTQASILYPLSFEPMPGPQLNDDGMAVTLDLHGATVDEAIDLGLQTVRLAARRGRTRVKLIHGSSTTRPAAHRRTIKRALHDLVDDGAFRPHATEGWRAKNYLVLSLDLTTTTDPTRIQLLDVM